jgi:alpha-1,2-mannosyltransferase
MSGWFDTLRDGAWLRLDRLRAYTVLMLLLSLVGIAGDAILSDHGRRSDGQPIGTDFSNVYAAGRLALAGEPQSAYDWPRHHAAEQAVFGPDTPYYGWHYPPIFLGIAALLALLPYGWALLSWQLSSFLAYLLSLRPILRGVPGWLVPAASFPAAFVNAGHGQNGFLTAALLGAGLAALPARPAIAGIFLGALCYKPQFCLLLPVALLAAREWRATVFAAATVLVLSLASLMIFGWATWLAFFDSLHLTRTVVLETGSTGWFKIQTVFAAARNWGLGLVPAYSAQAAVSLAAAALVMASWRSSADHPTRSAVLVAALLVATPYSLDYDLMALAPALAMLAARGLKEGFRPFEITLLAALWMLPLVARLAMQATGFPLGATMLILFLGYCSWACLWASRPRPLPSPLAESA